MRIACPDCAAEYDVPERLLDGAPRAMRCAKCGRVWTPSPSAAAAPEAEATPASLPEEVAVAAAPAPAPPPKRRTALLIAWIVTLGVIAGAAAGALTARERIVAAWPPAEHAYRLVGL